jgi:hypothetical protein
VEVVAGFVAWLRLSPEARDGKVAVLPTVERHCSAASVNRKLAALTSFCEFHARHGVELAGPLTTMQPAGRRGSGSATSYKPFLHHITESGPQRRLRLKLKTSRARPKVLTAVEAQTILDACEHLRDRLLFAVLLDCRLPDLPGLRSTPRTTYEPRSNDSVAPAQPHHPRRSLNGNGPPSRHCCATWTRPPPASAALRRRTGNCETHWPGPSVNVERQRRLGQTPHDAPNNHSSTPTDPHRTTHSPAPSTTPPMTDQSRSTT